MDALTVEINGMIYSDLVYNEQTGYYEKEIQAPDTGGIYDINVSYVDYSGQLYTDKRLLQVLIVLEEETLPKEFIGYLLDKNDFQIKDVVELQDYQIVIDEETNGKSTFSVMKKLNAGDGDIIVVKEDDLITYLGVIESPINENSENKHTFTAKYITNLFDRKVILKNESLISSVGIEDFISTTLKNEFINSADAILNKTFIDIEVKTHTKIQKSVDTENGIYNFHTFMTNATQNYNITYKFEIVNNRLKITIERKDDTLSLLDTNIAGLTEYLEKFEMDYVARVTAKCGDGSEYNLYLLNDRTTDTNKDNPNRVVGKVETIYVENVADAPQATADVMKGNRYNHLIQFKISLLSKLYDVRSWLIGQLFKIRTRNDEILETRLSSIIRNKNQTFIEVKLGNIRIDFIDKVGKEKLK